MMPKTPPIEVDVDVRADVQVRRPARCRVVETGLDAETVILEEIVLVEPLQAWEGEPVNQTTSTAIAALLRIGSNLALPAGTLIRITAELPGHDDAGA